MKDIPLLRYICKDYEMKLTMTAFKSRFSDLTEGELKITKYHCFASVNRKQGAPSGKL